MTSAPQRFPRSSVIALGIVWTIALVFGVLIGVLVPPSGWFAMFCLSIGGCVLLTFFAEMLIGRLDGVIVRMSTGVLGSTIILGVVSLFVMNG